jgi:signal transduction histidine kinase
MLLIATLSGLTLVCGLLPGIGIDWLLYLVTVSLYFSVFSLRTAIISTVLLFIVIEVNISFLNKWDWSSITGGITGLLPGFAFVAVYSLASSILTTQKERAEKLLHQLEESNAQLERAHAQLRSYASEVEELTIIRERTRLAGEIHDSLGHYLSILTIQLETISKLQERDPARAIEEVAEARRVAAQAMQEVRNAVAALRPTSVATPGLPEALTQLGRNFEHASEEAKLTLDLDTSLPPISPDLHVALYRAAQEALTNIRKHAHASKVLVRLRYEDEILELVVLDNGSGTPQSNDGEPSGGFGLIGLRERIELLGGKVCYGPSTPSGYRVTVQIRVPSAGELVPS